MVTMLVSLLRKEIGKNTSVRLTLVRFPNCLPEVVVGEPDQADMNCL